MNEPSPNYVLSQSGTGDNADNHPPATSHAWAISTRAALIEQKKALQQQVRALGSQIAALERLYNIHNDEN